MAIETREIGQTELRRLLSLEENHFVDVKDTRIAPGKLTQSLSAFANATGGELYIGIGQSQGVLTWSGFDNPESANGHIQAFEQMFPLGTGVEYYYLKAAEQPGLVLYVLVHKSGSIVSATNGTIYVRRGAQNLPVQTDKAMERLRLNKGLTSFEAESVQADIDLVENSTVLLEFLISVVPSAEPEPWLRKQQLLRGERLSVAATLLFAELPQAILPKRCGLKIYRYKTSEAEGTRDTLAGDPVSIEGHLYGQISEAVEKTVSTVQKLKVLTSDGLQSVSYPTEALHEIITNAVLHRDYSIARDIQVRIFENRIEVESGRATSVL